VRNGRSRSPKAIDFGTNRKRVCDFLLVINSNLGHILRHFWDTTTYWPKNAIFPTPLSFNVLTLGERFELLDESLRVLGLAEHFVILNSFRHFDTVPPCDKRQNGQTDRRTFRRWLMHEQATPWRPVEIEQNYAKSRQVKLGIDGFRGIAFLPARRYASAGLCDSDVSVRTSVWTSVTRRYCA